MFGQHYLAIPLVFISFFCQLIRSLKRKVHEQEEILSGKDKVVQLLQDELQDKAQEHEVSYISICYILSKLMRVTYFENC